MSFLFTPVLFPPCFLLSPLPTPFQGKEKKEEEKKKKRRKEKKRKEGFQKKKLTYKPSTKIPNRTQFKHTIFGPQTWSGYDEAYFPAVRDAIEEGDFAAAQQRVDRVARILNRAALRLNN